MEWLELHSYIMLQGIDIGIGKLAGRMQYPFLQDSS